MQAREQESWIKRIERFKDENRSLKEKLASLKRENNALKKAVRNTHRLFHSVPDGIVFVQEGKVAAMNELALAQLGYEAEEVIGRDFLDLVDPDSKELARSFQSKRTPEKGIEPQYETRLVTREGENLFYDVRVKRIRFDGRTGFLMSLTLNENKKQRERVLIQSGKMEALTTFASGLNRELARGIREIHKHIEHIRGLVDSGNSAVSEGLGNIESVAGRILDTTARLDCLSRGGDDSSNVIPFDLKKIAKDAISQIDPILHDMEAARQIKINLRTYLRSGSLLRGNPNEIRDVIVSLMLNGVEAMPQGGDLYLTTEENAGYAHIYVQDSGVGIPDHIHDRVFDPFFTTKGEDVRGLGLSLSYAIVKRHQGEIEVTSQKDQGTIFAVKLPLATPKESSKPRPVKRKVKNAHILIIEHEDIIRELLVQLFVGKGHRVVTAISGAEGLNKLKRKRFDLIIVDVQAPDVSGRAFFQEIGESNRGLPITWITDHGGEDRFTRSKGYPVELIIKKPLDMNKIVSQVIDLLISRAAEG